MFFALVIDQTVAQYPFTPSDLKIRFSNTSFPANPDLANFASLGVVPVQPVDPPSYDQDTQKREELTPVFVNNEWQQSWHVVDRTFEDAAKLRQMKSDSIRAERDDMLRLSDWTQLADAPVDAQAWKVYRQKLRDITTQDQFPDNVIWPVQP